MNRKLLQEEKVRSAHVAPKGKQIITMNPITMSKFTSFHTYSFLISFLCRMPGSPGKASMKKHEFEKNILLRYKLWAKTKRILLDFTFQDNWLKLKSKKEDETPSEIAISSCLYNRHFFSLSFFFHWKSNVGLDGRDGIPGEPGLDGVPGNEKNYLSIASF